MSQTAITTQMNIETTEDIKNAVITILKSGCKAVLIKGGHLKRPEHSDVYLHKNGHERIFSSNMSDTINTYGTGCSLSSAIASFIALGNDLELSISKAKTYVHQSISHGKDVKAGEGHGPHNHFFDP